MKVSESSKLIDCFCVTHSHIQASIYYFFFPEKVVNLIFYLCDVSLAIAF